MEVYRMTKHNFNMTINNIITHISFYVISFITFFIAHKIEPTNMAGPGLDLLALLLIVILLCVIIIKTFSNKKITVKKKFVIALIHLIGLTIFLYWVNYL